MNLHDILRYSLRALAIGCATPSLLAITVNLRPIADACLWEAQPNNNLGGLDTVASGRIATQPSSPGRCRPLFQFDLSSIPTNAVINSATLTLKVTKVPSPSIDSTNDLRRVLQSWGEGTGRGSNFGAAAKINEVTWKARFFPNLLWSSPGGAIGVDFSQTVSASKLLTIPGNVTFDSTPGLVADVQAWVQSTNLNFGWVLISQKEDIPRTAKRIGTREARVTSSQPLLVVDYTVPASVMLRIDRAEVSDGIFKLTFTAVLGNTYAVEFKDDLSTSIWTTLTNIDARSQTFDAAVTNQITSSQRFYRLEASPVQ